MRENIKSVGMIIALIIASVSLPIGIMGFNKQPIIYNYYTDNYYTNNTTIIYNNNTYIPEPEPELISYPLMRDEFIFTYLYQTEHTNYTYNATKQHRLYYWVIKNSTNSVIADIRIYDMVIYNYGFTNPYAVLGLGNQLFLENYYLLPYTTTWLIAFDFYADYAAESNNENITVYHQVRYIV